MIRSSEFWGGLFWLAIGSFVVWAGRDLGIGRLNDPGSGFALFWLGIMTMVFAAMIIVAAFRAPGAAVTSLWHDTRWAKVLFVIALLIAFGFLFEPVGFVVCAAVLLLVLMLTIDPVKPLVAIPIAVLAPVGIWYVVTKSLKIQMPSGILAGILG